MKPKWFSKIKNLKISGIKSIDKADVDLNDLNLFVGANGSGKSNLVFAFNLLKQGISDYKNPIGNIAFEKYVQKQGGADAILHYRRKKTPSANLRFYMQQAKNIETATCHDFSFESTVTNSLTFSPSAVEIVNWQARIGTGKADDNAAIEFTKYVDDIAIYHAHDTSPESKLRTNSKLSDTLKLHESFSNLPSFLYLLQKNYPEHYEEIQNAVHRVAPFFQKFVLKPESGAQKTIRLRWQSEYADEPFDVSDLSDGTLRFIALATVLLQPDDTLPSLIILDEPELGLHPYALHLLAGLMKSCSARTQIIAATQSVTLLSQFDWQDLVITDFLEGATTFRRLTEEDAKQWLTDYSLGELWEHNWLGGTPQWHA